MPTFQYKCVNKKGEVSKGKIKAISPRDAASFLQKDDLYILSIQPERYTSFPLFSLFYSAKLSTVELIDFTDHLASMLNSGSTIIDALLVYQEEENERFSLLINDIITDIKQGKNLSAALASYPQVFSPLFISFSKAGELTGRLSEALEYLAKEYRREYEFYERTKSALIYPSIVIAAAIGVISLLVFVVVPRITELTEAITGNLPLLTRIVAKSTKAIGAFGPWILGLLVLAVLLFVASLKNAKVRPKIDPWLLKLPVAGSLIRKYMLAKILRVVGSCIRYGIPLIDSLETAGSVVQNNLYKMSCSRIKDRIMKGMNIAKAFSLEGYFMFPKSIVRTLKGAEKSGTVDKSMLRISSFYESQIDRSLKRITDLIEPVLVLIMGVVVAAIAIAVIGPIYQLTSSVK